MIRAWQTGLTARVALAALTALGALTTGPAIAQAQAQAQTQGYPTRPLKIVVPFAAGSGSDVCARLIAEDFSAAFKQPFTVDNRADASAQIGTTQVACAAPDGYTLLIATNAGHSAIAETPGLAAFELMSWVGMVGPAALPEAIVEPLNAPLWRTLSKPEVRDKLVALGAEVVPSTATELDAFIRQQLLSWGTKIRNAGIAPE